jgi:hypothetical protein
LSEDNHTELCGNAEGDGRGVTERKVMTLSSFLDTVQTQYGLKKREREDIQRACVNELQHPAKQKWFQGSNNRIFGVVSALGHRRRERGEKSIARHSSMVREVSRYIKQEAVNGLPYDEWLKREVDKQLGPGLPWR